jgi:hypothetical protein
LGNAGVHICFTDMKYEIIYKRECFNYFFLF